MEPASDADIELVLPETTDCAADESGVHGGGEAAVRSGWRRRCQGPERRLTVLGFSLAPENGRPSGIWSDGATAWVADLDDGEAVSPTGCRTARARPSGTWRQEGRRWVCGRMGRRCGWRS